MQQAVELVAQRGELLRRHELRLARMRLLDCDHPLDGAGPGGEHRHTVGEIKRWFAEIDVEYLRSFPSTVLDDESDDLFGRAVDDWKVETWIAQLGWMWTLSGEGGVFVAIGRRR